jgi:hypothetical protein
MRCCCWGHRLEIYQGKKKVESLLSYYQIGRGKEKETHTYTHKHGGEVKRKKEKEKRKLFEGFRSTFNRCKATTRKEERNRKVKRRREVRVFVVGIFFTRNGEQNRQSVTLKRCGVQLHTHHTFLGLCPRAKVGKRKVG